MSAQCIDFKALRARLSFPEVLAHYQVEGKEKGGGQWQGYCPLPDHVHKGDGGKPRSPSFSVNFTRAIYNCFGCGGKGNVLEFVIRMEGFDPEIGEQFRRGALRAEEVFCGRAASDEPQKVGTSQLLAAPETPPTAVAAAVALPIVANAPLDFTLKDLDPTHPYLASRGFTPATIAEFGLGFASRGLMANRIAIPLENADGLLVGYAGRLVDDDAIDEDNPKYRFPGDRVKKGIQHVFRKTDLLYHPKELRGCRSKYLFVVEGFPSVWWFWQHGIRAVAAVMGSSIAAPQVERIVALTTPDARIIVIPDGDPAGLRLAHDALPLLAAHRLVRWIRLADGKQPTDWSGEELAEMKRHLLG